MFWRVALAEENKVSVGDTRSPVVVSVLILMGMLKKLATGSKLVNMILRTITDWSQMTPLSHLSGTAGRTQTGFSVRCFQSAVMVAAVRTVLSA